MAGAPALFQTPSSAASSQRLLQTYFSWLTLVQHIPNCTLSMVKPPSHLSHFHSPPPGPSTKRRKLEDDDASMSSKKQRTRVRYGLVIYTCLMPYVVTASLVENAIVESRRWVKQRIDYITVNGHDGTVWQTSPMLPCVYLSENYQIFVLTPEFISVWHAKYQSFAKLTLLERPIKTWVFVYLE